MRAIVKADFIDKYTRVKYKSGDAIELTDNRASEIMSAGPYIEPITETEHTANLDGMLIGELRQFAKDNGIDIAGMRKKAEIIQAIKDKGML